MTSAVVRDEILTFLSSFESQIPADLVVVIRSWPRLPEGIKRVIVKVVQAPYGADPDAAPAMPTLNVQIAKF